MIQGCYYNVLAEGSGSYNVAQFTEWGLDLYYKGLTTVFQKFLIVKFNLCICMLMQLLFEPFTIPPQKETKTQNKY